MTFDFEGTTLTAREPKAATWVALREFADLDLEDQANSLTLIVMAQDFLNGCLDPDSRVYFQDRLSDPDDDFDVDSLVPIIEWAFAEFSQPERPTGPPPGSRGRRPTTGQRSPGRSSSTASTRKSSPPPS